jgi:hypothetical protein
MACISQIHLDVGVRSVIIESLAGKVVSHLQLHQLLAQRADSLLGSRFLIYSSSAELHTVSTDTCSIQKKEKRGGMTLLSILKSPMLLLLRRNNISRTMFYGQWTLEYNHQVRHRSNSN